MRSAPASRGAAAIAAAWLALVGVTSAAQPPQAAPPPAAPPEADQPPRFPSSVEEVIVDVVVNDRARTPVGGLRREDFLIAEDGVPQSIASFEAVDITPSAAPRDALEPWPTVSANPAAGGRPPGRTFFVVFDDVRMTPAHAAASKRALIAFLRTSVDDADNLLLVTTSGSTWWGDQVAEGRDDVVALVAGLKGRQAVEVLPDKMSEAEAYRIVVQRDAEAFEHVLRRLKRIAPSLAVPRRETTGLLDGSECDPRMNPDGSADMDPGLVCESARVTHLRAVANLRDTLVFLERGLASLAGVRGRKAAVVVSPGFHYDAELAEFRSVVQASRRANAPVYFLSTVGLADLPLEMSAQVGQPIAPGDVSLALRDTREASGGSEVLAADTGGLVVRTNDLVKGLRRIADEARRHYLIGYTPTNTARDGKYRKIEVKLAAAGAGAADRGEWEIRARRGYYSPRDGGPVRDPGAPVREALASPFDFAGIPMRMAVYAFEDKAPGRTRCLLVGELDIRALAFHEAEGRAVASVELAFVTLGRDGGRTEHAERIEMKLQAATREQLTRDWYVVRRELELPAGVHQARIVARDSGSGRLGSVSHRIDIPPHFSYRITTPLVSDTLEPVPKGAPPRLAPIARREFGARSRVFLSLDVFGAERGDVSGRPRVSMGYTVFRPDGGVLTQLASKPIEPMPDGSLHRIVGFTAEDAGPGEYRIEGEVVDEQTGQVLLFSEAFTLRRAAGS
jgi:VWFA-related protein